MSFSKDICNSKRNLILTPRYTHSFSAFFYTHSVSARILFKCLDFTRTLFLPAFCFFFQFFYTLSFPACILFKRLDFNSISRAGVTKAPATPHMCHIWRPEEVNSRHCTSSKIFVLILLFTTWPVIGRGDTCTLQRKDVHVVSQQNVAWLRLRGLFSAKKPMRFEDLGAWFNLPSEKSPCFKLQILHVPKIPE